MPCEANLDLAGAFWGQEVLITTLLEELNDNGQSSQRDPQTVMRDLTQCGRLTPYQVEQLMQGRGQELVLGPYLILDRLGQGAMGHVFKARHRLLGRLVALKVLRRERLERPDALCRFQREAQAAARLAHPNMVTVYDAGVLDERHYLAMEYVAGIDLHRLVEQRGPLPADQASEYMRQTAQGLEHIHAAGLVHRDIKPANLMILGVRGQGSGVRGQDERASSLTPDPSLLTPLVKILDLGVVRLNFAEECTSSTTILTHGGIVMGTLDYLAPEQALMPHQADIRADLYGLGCTFYHLLTGRPPFPGGSLAQKLLQHQLESPLPVEALRDDMPDGLPEVVRKLMAKRPEDRYQTPSEVAAALTPFCSSGNRTPATLPLPEKQAEPVPRNKRSNARMEIRKGLVLSAIGVAFLLGVLAMSFSSSKGGTGSWSPVLAIRSAFGESTKPHTHSSEYRDPSLDAPGELRRFSSDARIYDLAVADGGILLARGDRTLQLLDSSRGRELRTFEGHTDWVSSVAISPDGRRALSGSGDRTVRLWSLATGREQRRFEAHTEAVLCVAFSPDGKCAVSGSQDRTLRMWEVASGKELRRFEGHGEMIRSVAFSPDGRTIASASFDKTVRLWEVANGKELRRFEGHGNHVLCAVFSPDGKQIVSGGYDGAARLWDVATGKEICCFSGPGEFVASVAFSPDGRRVLTGGERALRLWDVASRKELTRLEGHTDGVVSVRFAGDGRRAVSGGGDRTVRAWSLPR